MLSSGIITSPFTDLGMPCPTVYTTEEAADILKVSQKTILRMIKDGRLRAVKLGQGYRLTEEQIQDYIRENST